MAAKTNCGGTSETGSPAGMVCFGKNPEAADVKWSNVLIGRTEVFDGTCRKSHEKFDICHSQNVVESSCYDMLWVISDSEIRVKGSHLGREK